jgi:hypothetical protein
MTVKNGRGKLTTLVVALRFQFLIDAKRRRRPSTFVK